MILVSECSWGWWSKHRNASSEIRARAYKYSLDKWVLSKVGKYTYWTMTHGEVNVKISLYSCQIFNWTWIFSTDFLKALKYQMLWKFIQWQPSCPMRTDRQTDIQTKLTVVFRNSAKAHKNLSHSETLDRKCINYLKQKLSGALSGVVRCTCEATQCHHCAQLLAQHKRCDLNGWWMDRCFTAGRSPYDPKLSKKLKLPCVKVGHTEWPWPVGRHRR